MFLLCSLLTGLVPIKDAPAAPSPLAGITIQSEYIGNVIDFKLTLAFDAKRPTWTYTHLNREIGKMEETKLEGSYEVQGDLAIFTIERGGRGKGGLNFLRIKDSVYFDRFFRADDGRLRHTRQIYADSAGKFRPVELQRIHFAPPDLDAPHDTLVIHYQGERTVWGDKGPATTPIDLKITYKRQERFYYEAIDADRSITLVPLSLYFTVSEGKLLMAGPGVRIHDVHGFGVELLKAR